MVACFLLGVAAMIYPLNYLATNGDSHATERYVILLRCHPPESRQQRTIPCACTGLGLGGGWADTRVHGWVPRWSVGPRVGWARLLQDYRAGAGSKHAR